MTKTIILTDGTYDFITRALSENLLDEDETIIYTAVFGNGIEMDVKVCGADDETAWTEAVLFANGYEVACTDCMDEILGEWSLPYKGDTYTANVIKAE